LPERDPLSYMPTVFVVGSGREPLAGAADLEFGILLRDLDLMTLVAVAEAGTERIAVDLDSVYGLGADDAAAKFVVERLGIRIVMTRRPSLAALVAESGGLGLVRVFAFDSTGLERALESHPARPRVGTVISPGPVLSHLTAADLERLPRPIVADGLIDAPDRARRLLAVADSVVVDPECARGLAAAIGNPR
jgi:glycerol-3-phosphate responsive antiterminator